MATIQEAINKLDYIEKLTKNPSSFSKEEIKEQPSDTPLIKVLKRDIQAPEIIKQKDQEISNWKTELTQEQNKTKQLEIQITNKDNIISQKDKTIQSLQLKNEKLSESYKQIINHFANARQLISHLQKDLSATQQDKAHIQKELDDALAILNKPTAEIAIQTDLTAEQITKMETDITKYQTDIQTEQAKVSSLNNQISTCQAEIKDLQKKVKELNYNREEVNLLNYTKKEITATPIGFYEADVKIDANSLLKELQDESKWTQLRYECKDIRLKLIELAQNEIARRDLQTKINQLVKNREELQTKYDMEVRSKEELLEDLNFYRNYAGVICVYSNMLLETDPQSKVLKRVAESHVGRLGWNGSPHLYIYDTEPKDKALDLRGLVNHYGNLPTRDEISLRTVKTGFKSIFVYKTENSGKLTLSFTNFKNLDYHGKILWGHKWERFPLHFLYGNLFNQNYYFLGNVGYHEKFLFVNKTGTNPRLISHKPVYNNSTAYEFTYEFVS